MKILCISDDKDVLVYSPNIAQRYKDVDMILSAGDLPLKYYEYIVSSLNKPFYFVFGNHHTEELTRFKKTDVLGPSGAMADFGKPVFNQGVGGDFIDGKVVRDKKSGLIIAGLGGSMRYNDGRHQFSETEMFFRILSMIPRLIYNKLRHGRFVDILLTHAPPRNYGDKEDLCHRGFSSFLLFIRYFKPRYLLHGHIHLIDMNAERVKEYRGCRIINVYSSYVLQEDERNGQGQL
ncbi:MAG: metallophosphoesterase [Sphaerochaetaceae bacterium]